MRWMRGPLKTIGPLSFSYFGAFFSIKYISHSSNLKSISFLQIDRMSVFLSICLFHNFSSTAEPFWAEIDGRFPLVMVLGNQIMPGKRLLEKQQFVFFFIILLLLSLFLPVCVYNIHMITLTWHDCIWSIFLFIVTSCIGNRR